MFEKKIISLFQRIISGCKLENFYTTGTPKKIDCFSADGFYAHSNTVFQVMGCFCLYKPGQEVRLLLTEEEIEGGIKERIMDELQEQYIKETKKRLPFCGNVGM